MNEMLGQFRSDAFDGKNILVSGGTSGIGLEIARGLARLGASVTVTGSSEAKLAALRSSDETLSCERLDVTDENAIQSFVAGLPGLDVLINAAGISRPNQEYQDEVFMQVMNTNLISAMRLSTAALPLLEKTTGSILNVASMLSYLADATVPAYCASKSGILGLTRALAHRYGAKGIRVNAIAPGYHRTAMTKELWDNPKYADRIASRTALKRWGEADDLVGAAVFLSSSAAAYITGACLAVDGGYVVG